MSNDNPPPPPRPPARPDVEKVFKRLTESDRKPPPRGDDSARGGPARLEETGGEQNER